MPRSRSCELTIWWRCCAKYSDSPDPNMHVEYASLFPLANSHIKTDYSVLVANAYDRNVAGDVVFHLDDLLGRLGNVGAVREREVVGYLLFDSHCRASLGGCSFSAQALGINLDAADAE